MAIRRHAIYSKEAITSQMVLQIVRISAPLKEIGVAQHVNDIRFQTGSRNMTASSEMSQIILIHVTSLGFFATARLPCLVLLCCCCCFSAGVLTVSVSPASVLEFTSYSIQCSFPGDNVTSLRIQRLSPLATVLDYNNVSSTSVIHADWQVDN